MVKIYTKTGDRGTTSLFGGKRISKDSARIEAYGCVDELNSVIGTVVAKKPASVVLKKLVRVQGELFVLGGDLASPLDTKTKIPRITRAYVGRLEKEIDGLEHELPQLRNFILPGGSKVGAHLHLARAVARRAERAVVNLSLEEKINPIAQTYVNRLSDWLFVLARYANKIEGVKEIPWKGRGK